MENIKITKIINKQSQNGHNKTLSILLFIFRKFIFSYNSLEKVKSSKTIISIIIMIIPKMQNIEQNTP